MGLIFRLVYVTTVSPDLNVERVRQRVLSGGHDVPEDRIRSRWDRSMINLTWFAQRADRALVLDNSGVELEILALRHLGGLLELRQPQHPAAEFLEMLTGKPALDPIELF